jgi:hypothetical protein
LCVPKGIEVPGHPEVLGLGICRDLVNDIPALRVTLPGKLRNPERTLFSSQRIEIHYIL